jgi:hypothetical protein
MTAVTRFEDLIAWQEARKLMQLAYKVTSEGQFAKDFEMRDQLRSAALSAMTNIAEGFDNESSVEFARFLGIAPAIPSMSLRGRFSRSNPPFSARRLLRTSQ